MIKLTSSIQSKLVDLPESGMGFQIIEATLKDYSHKEYIVLNASIAEPIDNRSLNEVFTFMAKSGIDEIYKYASAEDEIIDVKMASDMSIIMEKQAFMAKATALESKVELTKEGEKFVRFSHYEDDKRIDQTRSCFIT